MRRLHGGNIRWPKLGGVELATRRIVVEVRPRPMRLAFLLERPGKAPKLLDELRSIRLKGERQKRFSMQSVGVPQNMTWKQAQLLFRMLGLRGSLLDEVYGPAPSLSATRPKHGSDGTNTVAATIPVHILVRPPMPPDHTNFITFLAGTRRHHLILTSISTSLNSSSFFASPPLFWKEKPSNPVFINFNKYSKKLRSTSTDDQERVRKILEHLGLDPKLMTLAYGHNLDHHSFNADWL